MEKELCKKISNRWHKLYEACTGVHRIDYFPEILFTLFLEPKANDIQYSNVFSDKSLIDLFFDNRVKNVRVPKTIIFNNHGLFYDTDHRLISKEKAIEIVDNIGEVVIQPTIDSSSGQDVLILNLKNEKDIKTGKTVDEIFNYYKNNFIIQSKFTNKYLKMAQFKWPKITKEYIIRLIDLIRKEM